MRDRERSSGLKLRRGVTGKRERDELKERKKIKKYLFTVVGSQILLAMAPSMYTIFCSLKRQK